MRSVLSGIAVGGALVAATALSRAAVSDPKFTEQVVVAPRGLGGTTGIAWATDGSSRLFLMRQIGQVRIVENGLLRTKAFANISPIVTDTECGLIGMTFDPDFVDNHYVYFFVSVSQTEQQIIRYVVDGNVGSAKTIVVEGLPTRGSGHNGGALGFGPDGKLYWAIGDLYDGIGVGQDLSSLAAKVGRANRDGSVPEDNPFFDGAGPNEDRIWARGFRNPFSFTWQPSTERLWLNVVGAQYEQIFTPVAADHGGWASYQNDQPEGYLSPIISYRTHGADGTGLTAAQRTNGVATFSTAVPHGFRVGAKLTVSGVSDASFDGSGYISDVPSATSFSLPHVGPDVASSGGLVSSLELGAAVTGGAFWDSSSVPEEYRGNFFFTDYISGHIARVVAPPGELGETPRVSSVDYWATATNPIDIDIGPDGDLYYATFSGGVYRVGYVATAQAIVVSKLHLRLDEGGRAAVGVRLALEPAAPVSVSVANGSGDWDVQPETTLLTFDASNWSVPQIVNIVAAQDDDAVRDRAVIELSSEDLATESIDARVTEDDFPESASGGAGGEPPESGAGGQALPQAGVSPEESGGSPAEIGNRDVPGGDSDGGAAADTAPASRDRQDGCACQVGSGGSSAWFVTLAVLALGRRRRSL